MKRIKRFHLIVLLAIAAGWIARDLLPDAPAIVPSVQAQGVGVSNTTGSNVVYTTGSDPRTLVRWEFSTGGRLLDYTILGRPIFTN